MIQRIQTIYLFIIALIAGLLLYINPSFLEMQGYSEWAGSQKGVLGLHFKAAEFMVNDSITHTENLPLMSYTLMIIVALAFFGILLFKNRRLQMLLTAFNFIFILVLYILMVYYSIKLRGHITQEIETDIAIGLFFPMFLPVFNYMALVRINYDEQLVRSTDRLRK